MTAQCLVLALVSLSRTQRRCLRVLGEVSSVSHAARKLHWSQAQLRACIQEVQVCMGVQHIDLTANRVLLSASLQALLRQGTDAAATPRAAVTGP